jgi:hypothetical protein
VRVLDLRGERALDRSEELSETEAQKHAAVRKPCHSCHALFFNLIRMLFAACSLSCPRGTLIWCGWVDCRSGSRR